MSTDINLPSLTPTMTHATQLNWLVAEGDHVTVGQAIAEVETDKSVLELESPADGTLAKQLVPSGAEDVEVGTKIAVIGDIEQASEESIDQQEITQAPESRAPANPVQNNPAANKGPAEHNSSAKLGDRIKSSPSARRVAAMHGIDIATLRGSGPSGRIVKIDVIRAAEGVIENTSPSTASATLEDSHFHQSPSKDTFVDTPLTGMRKTIAKTLQHSKQTIPHFSLEANINADQLVILRNALNSSADQNKVSLNDFVVAASARALHEFPQLNASFVEDKIRRYRSVDVSVAVALEDGLVTPIIVGADKLSVQEISIKIKQLATQARAGKLKPEDYTGGSMTVSNLGATGIRSFYAIINPPQTSILAVGACEKRPILKDDALAVGYEISTTLSCDHRIVDGQPGSNFLMRIKQLLEDPVSLLQPNP